MRLIDADALKDLLKEYCVDGDSIVQGWYCTMGIDECIDNAPTVDAVRQGHWVRFYGDHIHMGLRPKWDCCSECGMVETATRFCPHCGARMDGEA